MQLPYQQGDFSLFETSRLWILESSWHPCIPSAILISCFSVFCMNCTHGLFSEFWLTHRLLWKCWPDSTKIFCTATGFLNRADSAFFRVSKYTYDSRFDTCRADKSSAVGQFKLNVSFGGRLVSATPLYKDLDPPLTTFIGVRHWW